MVLLVPDDPDESAEEMTDGVPAETDADDDQPKAQLDDTQASKSAQKVDLDLDDAPFLEDEEDEEDIPFEDSEAAVVIKGEKKSLNINLDIQSLLRNKLVWAGGVILLLVLIIVVLLMREPEPLPPSEQLNSPPPSQQTTEPTMVPDNPDATLVRMTPFLVEQKTSTGEIRLLDIRIALSTTNEALVTQFTQETFAVRNAVFYYLKNKDIRFLTDKENSEKLKSELLAVVNQYMSFGQFDQLLIEQYLVR